MQSYITSVSGTNFNEDQLGRRQTRS